MAMQDCREQDATGPNSDSTRQNSLYLPQFQHIRRQNIQYHSQDPGPEKGAGNLLGFLAISVATGIACAMASLLGFGAGLWMAIFWYVIGCWIGFAVPVAAYLIASVAQKTGPDRVHPKYT